ncbi:MAG: hypothetical protein AAF621_05370 [Pseudomonadota bacterium]
MNGYTPGNTPNFYDFNSADDTTEYEIIPKGTLAKVRMTIKPGGYDDQTRGLTGGWATHKSVSGAIYLNCEAVILEGQYAKRKLWFLIGLHSQKGPEWANMGRSLIKGILNSAHGLSTKDNSPNAQSARRISGMGDLDGIVFAAKIDVEKDMNGNDKNTIKTAITADHKDYATIMSGGGFNAPPQSSNNTPPHTPNVPSWAQ